LVNETAVSQSQQSDAIPVVYKQWSLSVEINPFGTLSGWNNILQVGIGGDGAYGDRTPAIFFNSDTSLHFMTAISGHWNYYYPDTENILIGEWTMVDIAQIRRSDGDYNFTISIGNNIGRHRIIKFYFIKIIFC